MARTTSFTKRTLIGKANSTMVIATSIAAFVLVFTLVAGKAMLGQMGYQNKVIDAKKTALKQIESDLKAVGSLNESYRNFVDDNPNVLGGDANGTASQDGDNAKLVLDALPSRYDFPALTTSLEALVTGQNLQILGISGTDEEAVQGLQKTSGQPEPIAMPFQLQVSGAYASIQSLIDSFSRSIRPFQIHSLEIAGDENSMLLNINAQTFFQPEKTLNIEQKVVK
ncbi:MAG TPA: type 4a pilus biogenesis protein PilO [Candidatus Saccharimonadales bacterium]|nr:type 4a pilus biogenesis protein PilO [Candidatus Saccharimonadales bacterium]